MTGKGDAKGLVLVQIRLPKALVKALDHRCVDLEMSRVRYIERLLRQALEQDGRRGSAGEAEG